MLVLIRSTSMNYARLTEHITPFNETLLFPGLPAQWNLETTTGLLRLSAELHRQAAMIGYINAFGLMALAAAAAVPLAALLKRPSA
ncbi:hypothetical protein ACFQU2_11060 [Siccirubricoccus deserti]